MNTMGSKLTWRNIEAVLDAAGITDYYVDYVTGIAYIPFTSPAEVLSPLEYEMWKRKERRFMLERMREEGRL